MILDPRGSNVIQFPVVPRPRPLPTERPWPFNCIEGPARLPPVTADRFAGVRLQDEELFRPNPRYKPDTPAAVAAMATDLRALEFDLENVLLQYKFTHPGLVPLDLVPVMLGIVKKLLRQAQLPPR